MELQNKTARLKIKDSTIASGTEQASSESPESAGANSSHNAITFGLPEGKSEALLPRNGSDSPTYIPLTGSQSKPENNGAFYGISGAYASFAQERQNPSTGKSGTRNFRGALANSRTASAAK